MEQMTLDASVAAGFRGRTGECELRDESGEMLGLFVPRAELYEWARSLSTDEEIEAARREPNGSTTDEILRRLGAR